MKKETQNLKLIRDISAVDQTAFEDFFMVIAKNIEDSLIQSGAVAGKDYSYIDLYNLAQPFVLERFKTMPNFHFSISWPSYDKE